MIDEVKEFLRGALLFERDEVEEMGITDCRRVNQARNSFIHSEVKISVSTPEDRDKIMGKGRLLASYVDNDRKPTAGLRMEVPRYLESTFKTLYNVGTDLRRNHSPNTKKYIKFDEHKYDLFLEVRLDGRRDWLRIDPETAREIAAENNKKMLTQVRSSTNNDGRVCAIAPPPRIPPSSVNMLPIGRPRNNVDMNDMAPARSEGDAGAESQRPHPRDVDTLMEQDQPLGTDEARITRVPWANKDAGGMTGRDGMVGSSGRVGGWPPSAFTPAPTAPSSKQTWIPAARPSVGT